MTQKEFEAEHAYWLKHIGEEWIHAAPITQEQLEERQSAALVYHQELTGRPMELHLFTCHDCPGRRFCVLAYDSYNTQGDCLLNK